MRSVVTWHTICIEEGVVGYRMARLGESTHLFVSGPRPAYQTPEDAMTWTKPEAEVVAVTMEVTAYVATL